MSASFVVVIPARYASTRLPGKPLLDIGGRPMIQHAYECALASGARQVVVATDDERIENAARSFGASVQMTRASHRSGTERVAEVADRLGLQAREVVVNLQGDEPLLPARLVTQLAATLAERPEAEMATLCVPIEDDAEVFDPSVVKVVFDDHGRALYFSRAVIPWHRDDFSSEPRRRGPGAEHFRHIGLYAYRAGYLRAYVAQPPTRLERAESLEQLRALYHGAHIHVARAMVPPGPGVDTPDDLERVRRLVSALDN